MNTTDWTLLRSFLAVVEMGSLSSAATRLAASQPTIGRHIRELEEEFGVVLFKRSVRGLDPTEAALTLVEDARAMGEAARTLALKAAGRSQRLVGSVRITASVIVANLLLPRIVVALREAEPEIRIEIVPSDLTQNLIRRDADIAVRMVDPTQNALIARKLGDAPVGMFGTRAYFDRRGRIRALEDLQGHDLIGFDRSDDVIKAYAALGYVVTREDFSIRCDEQMAYWHLILAGAGVGFAQTLLAARHPELERVDIGMRLPSMPVWLVMHEEVRSNVRIRRVADFLTVSLGDALRTV